MPSCAFFCGRGAGVLFSSPLSQNQLESASCGECMLCILLGVGRERPYKTISNPQVAKNEGCACFMGGVRWCVFLYTFRIFSITAPSTFPSLSVHSIAHAMYFPCPSIFCPSSIRLPSIFHPFSIFFPPIFRQCSVHVPRAVRPYSIGYAMCFPCSSIFPPVSAHVPSMFRPYSVCVPLSSIRFP